MAYEMVFLERADLLKYQMYAQLVRLHDQELTVTDIARQMHTKYQATYSVFQEVVADIKDETGLPNKTIRKQLLSPGAKPLSMDAYRARLVERSMLFQLLNYAVQTTNPQLSTFLEAHYVSRSTMTRKLSPCNRFLKHWGLKFRLAQVGFVGPEMSVLLPVHLILVGVSRHRVAVLYDLLAGYASRAGSIGDLGVELFVAHARRVLLGGQPFAAE